MRRLLLNADGFGMTAGVNEGIEACIAFGSVRSISANVNFPRAEALPGLVERFDFLSVGCHLNPIVGPPVLDPGMVPTLVGADGLFHYRGFRRRFTKGLIDRDELRAELLAQLRRTRELVGDNFTHVDFHMGLHRLPRLYPIFLEMVAASGTNRMRTHRYLAGLDTDNPRLGHWQALLSSPTRLPKYAYNLGLRAWAQGRGFAMPDSWVALDDIAVRPESISVDRYVRLLANLPDGTHEFVAHPGIVDDDLRAMSSYVEPRERELDVLTSPAFREGLAAHGVELCGYRDLR